MGFKLLSNYFYRTVACTRTCIPLEEATGISTGKYDLKATTGKVRLAKEGLHKVPYPGTASADLFSWMVRRNACG